MFLSLLFSALQLTTNVLSISNAAEIFQKILILNSSRLARLSVSSGVGGLVAF